MRYILIAAAVFGLMWTVGRFHKRHISVFMAFVWSVLWIGVGVVALIPEVTNRIADAFGIGRGADVIIYSAIVVILALVFRISIRLEQLDRAITTVTRELALREHDRK